jgi:hypothetical protein
MFLSKCKENIVTCSLQIASRNRYFTSTDTHILQVTAAKIGTMFSLVVAWKRRLTMQLETRLATADCDLRFPIQLSTD